MENLVCSICSEGARDGVHKFTLIVINDLYEDRLVERLRKNGVEVVLYRRKPDSAWNLLPYLARLRRDIRLNRYDIIHVHLGLGALVGCIASIGMAIPVLYTLHAVRSPVRTSAEKFCDAFAAKFVTKFIAISTAVRDSYQALADIRSMGIVTNGIELMHFNPGTISNAIPRIICVAGLRHRIKGQDILLKALRCLKERGMRFHCQLVGEGLSRSFLEQMVQELNLPENVEFLGVRFDVPQLLAKSDMLVLPSRSEGFGLAIIEAMASGVPVVASNIDGPREIISHGRNGYLFEAENVHDLAEKMAFLLDHPVIRKNLAEQGLKDVGNYAIEVTFRNYLKAYSELIWFTQPDVLFQVDTKA